MLTLRPYQQDAIDALYDYLRAEDGHPLVVLPTGSGKSLVMAELVRDAITSWPETRILILAHVKELLEQNARELRGHFSTVDLGIYSAGLKSRDTGNQVVVASIQSVHRRAFDLGLFDLVLVDEAHLIPRTSSTMYQRFLANAQLVNPQLRVIGLTATDYRLDSGRLTEGYDRVFDAVAYEANVGDLIREGYLCRVTTRRTGTQLDVSGVHRRGGEFIAGELEAAVDSDAVTRAAVREIIAAGQDRLAWLVFCSGVKHAKHVAVELRSQGIPAQVVTGQTPAADRDGRIKAFKRGDLRALVNVNVLTTGFNVPQVDLLAMLRPTESTGLYVQMVGRGTRNAPGKVECLVLDFAGNIERHGPIDAVVVDRGCRGDGDGEAPVKACPKCGTYALIAVKVCPECGYKFPPPAPKLEPKAANRAILSDDRLPPEWAEVTAVRYLHHAKAGKPPSLRVVYQCGLSQHSEWVCLEHGGYAAEQAAIWWRCRGAIPVPATVKEALGRQFELKQPAFIQIRKEGRFDRVVSYRFAVDPGAHARDERDSGGSNEPRSRQGQEGQKVERVFGDETPLGGGGGGHGPQNVVCPF